MYQPEPYNELKNDEPTFSEEQFTEPQVFTEEQEPTQTTEENEAVEIQPEETVEQPGAETEPPAVNEEIEPIDLEELQKIQSKMPATDPEAPIGSNKNPIRIIQQGNQYITTQDVSEDHLQQIIQVLTNQALLSGSQSKASAIYNRNTNKRIIFRVTKAKRRKEPQEVEEEVSEDDFDFKRGRTSFSEFFSKRRRREEEEEEDPDFEPDLPEEEVLPFPLVRKKTTSGQDLTVNEEDESDDNAPSDGGYSDFVKVDDEEEEEEEKPKDFICDVCGQGFDTKAGLARHKGVKHGGADNKTRWTNPYIASVRRRNKLQEAVSGATDDDLIEFVAPRLSKILSPWDHLLMRSEQGDPPLPHVPGLVYEYLSLVEQAKSFLAEHLAPKIEKEKPVAKARPAPASVKLRRLQEEQQKKDQSNLNSGDNDDNNNGEVIVRIDNDEQSTAMGLSMGRYVVEEPLKEQFLPRRFRSILASQRIARVRQEEEEARRRELGETDENAPPSPLYDTDNIRGVSMPKKAVVAVETSAEKEAVEGDYFSRKNMGHLASINDPGFGDEVLLLQDGGIGGPIPDDWLQSGSYLAVLTENGATSELVMEASTGKLYHKPTGHLVSLGGSTTVADASTIEEAQGTGAEANEQSRELESEQTNQEIEDMASGAPVQVIDDTTQQIVDVDSMFPGVAVTEISPGVCMVSKPNGARFQVEHGGDGITLETLQTVLALDDQG